MAELAQPPRRLQRRDAKKRFSDEWLVSFPTPAKRSKLVTTQTNRSAGLAMDGASQTLKRTEIHPNVGLAMDTSPCPYPMPLKVTQVYQRRARNSSTRRTLPPPPMEEQMFNSSTQKPEDGMQKANVDTNNLKFDSLCMPPFKVGDVVWAKACMREGANWPGVIVDPSLAAQQQHGQRAYTDRFCVMFYGKAGRGKYRDFCWVHVNNIWAFADYKGASSGGHGYEADLDLAISEARQEMKKRNWRLEDCNMWSDANDNNDLGEPESIMVTCPSVPTSITVVCFGVEGAYYPKLHEVICLCPSCKGRTPLVSLSRWEAHTGCRQKKWKVSVRLKSSSQTLLSWLQSMINNGAMNLAFQVSSQEQLLKARLQVPYEPVALKWTLEKCAVCGWVEDYDDNQILVCNRCQIGMHEECYGVRASETGGSFICRACESPEKSRECCLCPVRGGALKPSVIPDLWVHVYCAWFVKGVFFRDVTKMEPADGILSIDISKFKQQCVICRQSHGACISCEECEATFHATCALRAGYRMELSTITGRDEFKKVSYCAQHRRPSENSRLVIAAFEAELLRQEKLRQEELEAELLQQEKLRQEEQDSSTSTSNRNEEDVSTPCSLTSEESEESSRSGSEDEEIRWTCSRAYAYRGRPYHKAGNREAVPDTHAGFTHHDLKDILSLRKLPDAPEILSIEERLINLERTQSSRICFGKSPIHKWGLFACRDIQEGEMVVEYRGEIVRRSVADIREKRYKHQGKDCYLFKVSEEMVIDATNKGNIARLINHSCAPNCFARIFPVKRAGNTCIIFIAKHNVKAGEELTYDYLFDPENRAVPCLCGASNCRKFIC